MSDRRDGVDASPSKGPGISLKSWKDGIAPAFLALGLNVVYLDRLAPTTLLVGGLAPAIVGAILGGLLAYWCLYYVPAMWGVRTRQSVSVVASSTFGIRGALLVSSMLTVAIHIVWFAVTIEYAAQYSLSGLVSCGLLDAKNLASNHRGSWAVPKPLFLAVAASWSIASAVIGTLAVRLVSAVLSAYIVFPALVIGALVVWAMPTVVSGPIDTMPFTQGGGRALISMVQLIFAFLAAQSLTNIEWGAVTSTERDVRNGGLVGIMLTMPLVAILSLLIVAGSLGRTQQTPLPLGNSRSAPMTGRLDVARELPAITIPGSRNRGGPTLREALLNGLGGRLGGTALLILALAMLGPACTNPFQIAQQLSGLWPGIPRWAWALAGAFATWPLILSGWSKDLESVFGVLGAIAAPVMGAISADFARSQGVWRGPCKGVNVAGYGAWVAGVGAAAAIAYWGQTMLVTRYLPSSVVGFATAFGVYLILSAIKRERVAATPAIPVAGLE